VLRAVPLSRRVLEARFEKLLGRTPHEEITRIQVGRVKELLAETDLPLAAVAHRAGYKHVEYMSVVFKRETGLPPSQYRREVRRR
jgi:LacI family transcriptional regulator